MEMNAVSLKSMDKEREKKEGGEERHTQRQTEERRDRGKERSRKKCCTCDERGQLVLRLKLT